MGHGGLALPAAIHPKRSRPMPEPLPSPNLNDLEEQPGHLIRRAQQISVSMFHETLGRDVTPVQYAVLRALLEHPGIDQVTLASEAALDTSTAADTAARLEAKGWIAREVLARGQRSLSLTPAGQAVLAGLEDGIVAMRDTLLGRFDPPEQVEFMRLLRKFVQLNNERSRAPLRRGAARG